MLQQNRFTVVSRSVAEKNNIFISLALKDCCDLYSRHVFNWCRLWVRSNSLLFLLT